MDTISHRHGIIIEDIAVIFLKREGFSILGHPSVENSYSPFDYEVEKMTNPISLK
jgi:hypothetical protein